MRGGAGLLIGAGGAPSARRGESVPGVWHADQQVLTRGVVCDACRRRPVVPEERPPVSCVLRTGKRAFFAPATTVDSD